MTDIPRQPRLNLAQHLKDPLLFSCTPRYTAIQIKSLHQQIIGLALPKRFDSGLNRLESGIGLVPTDSALSFSLSRRVSFCH